VRKFGLVSTRRLWMTRLDLTDDNVAPALQAAKERLQRSQLEVRPISASSSDHSNLHHIAGQTRPRTPSPTKSRRTRPRWYLERSLSNHKFTFMPYVCLSKQRRKRLHPLNKQAVRTVIIIDRSIGVCTIICCTNSPLVYQQM
jgi:hypothetical protein